MLHIDYLYVNKYDISKTCCKIIEKYIKLLEEKDKTLFQILEEIYSLKRVIPKRKNVFVNFFQKMQKQEFLKLLAMSF